MNSAQIHLLVNHVPVFGVFFGLIALGWSIWKGSREMRLVAVGLFVISGLFAWIATTTGEGAEEMVEHLSGVKESLIERHEDAAEVTNVFIMILALGAAALEALAHFKAQLLKPQWLKWGHTAVLGLAVLTSGLLIRTAHLGGQIRHTEIRADSGTKTHKSPSGEKKSHHRNHHDDD